MKIILASILFGVLLPIAALSAEVGQPISLLTVDARLQITRQSDFATKKREYLDQARDEMREMQHPQYRFTDGGPVVGSKTGGTVDREVYTAWNDVKTAAQKLQATTEENWPRAMTSYEQAAARLRAVLERAHPDDE
jgi:hypothetical protein